MSFMTRLALPGGALLALAGLAASGHAEQFDAVSPETAAPVVQTDGPRFQLSAEAALEQELQSYEVAISVPTAADLALDIAAVEPAEEPDAKALGTGVASFYGQRFAGRPTASGERFNPQALTAAHRTLPFGSKVRVTNAANGRSVVVRINDRGPFHGGRQIDLSRGAAERIGLVSRGHGKVEMELLSG